MITTEILACTERQLVRTYPRLIRINSSNYDPVSMWNHGIHMVALNVQTPGKLSSYVWFTVYYIQLGIYYVGYAMYLNQGKFRQNGGCGYILKPKVMRDRDEKGLL